LILGPLAGSTPNSWNFRTEAIQKPLLVFDPSGTKTDRWNEHGLDQYGPYDQRTFAPKQLRVAVVCRATHEGQVDAFIAKFLDGLPIIKTGTGQWTRVPYAKGFIRRYALEAPKVQLFAAKTASVADYTAACAAVEAVGLRPVRLPKLIDVRVHWHVPQMDRLAVLTDAVALQVRAMEERILCM
jgi:hypothetical protein